MWSKYINIDQGWFCNLYSIFLIVVAVIFHISIRFWLKATKTVEFPKRVVFYSKKYYSITILATYII